MSGSRLAYPPGGSSGGSGSLQYAICTGRPTLASGNYNPAADQLAKTTLYFTSILNDGNITNANFQIVLYNGSTLVEVGSAQLSLVTPTLTSGKIKNIYIDYNSGTPQIVLGADWTNDTTPSETLTTQSATLGGVLISIPVLSGTPAYHYVGFLKASTTNQMEDSKAKRYLRSQYNKVNKIVQIIEATDSWTLNSTTQRQANGSAANQIDALFDGNTPIDFDIQVSFGLPTAVSQGYLSNVGIDGTTSGQLTASYTSQTGTNCLFTNLVRFVNTPTLGRHFFTWLETCATTGGNITIYGDNGHGGSDTINSNMSGLISI